MTINNFDFAAPNSPVFIIAELSANHNGKFENALATVRAAKRAGADAIKLQTYTADTMTLDVRKEDFRLSQGTIWDGMYLHDLYKKAYTPWEWHKDLFEAAREEGLVCFSSPFDFSAVDFLESLDAPAYKIASFEITAVPLIKCAPSKKKPMIISTGIAGEEDISLAVEACREVGNEQIILLQCTSSYPAPIERANLVMIPDMAQKYNVLTGLSDHTLGTVVPVVATALGARVIEKHFILDKAIGGPDSSFSLDEKEFSEMVTAVRNAEKAMGTVDYTLSEAKKNSRAFSRSLYIAEDLKEGAEFTHDNLRSVRPGFGLPPRYLDEIIGKKAAEDLSAGTAMKWEYIAD